MARIGFDGLMISARAKGIGRVQRHALDALVADGQHEIVAFVREDVDLDGVEVIRLRARPTILWELIGMPRAVRRHRLDLLLTFTERLPLRCSAPIVVWLFENPLHRIEQNRVVGARRWYRASDRLTELVWKRSLRIAAHVAMGSHATELEVVAAVPQLAGRTSVVYPGLAPGFGPSIRREDGVYVFHLGSNDPRDNTDVAVEACLRAGAPLVVAGGWSGNGAVTLGRVSDERLVELYRGASVFLDPTLYEGFGYGVLEAMACGAPVVASNRTSIPEVVGGAGLLCDPRDIDGLASAIRRVLDDPRLAEQLRARGLARAAAFTWERAAVGLNDAIGGALS